MQVIEGDKKGNWCLWEYNWAILSLGNINTEAWFSRLGVGYEFNELAL
jgi:hypothetical protein